MPSNRSRSGSATGRKLNPSIMPRTLRGARQLVPAGGSDTTDDTGSFRVFGLTPGTYYVTAMLRASAPDTDLVQGATPLVWKDEIFLSVSYSTGAVLAKAKGAERYLLNVSRLRRRWSPGPIG